MSLRKILLRLMLLALALAAVAGVLAVLVAGSHIVGRVVATAIEAAVAAGLMLGASFLVDRERARLAGLFGMVAVLLAFLIGLMITWDFHPARRSDFDLPATLFLIICATPPMMLALRVMKADRGLWAGVVGVATGAAASGIILVAIWWNAFTSYRGGGGGGSGYPYWSYEEHLYASAWAVVAFGVLIACCLAGVGVERRWWRWIGVVTAAGASVWFVVGIWEELHGADLPISCVVGVAVIAAHANLCMLCELKPNQRWLRWGTIGMTVMAVGLVQMLVAQKDAANEDSIWGRGAGAAGIVAACGSLALLIVSKLNRKIVTRTVPENVKELTLICPWCQRKQTMPLGKSSCGGCGLNFEIAVVEPRCANCDYLLYAITSDRCPECGTPIQRKPGSSNVEAAQGTAAVQRL